jgi:hypothetical protein
MNTPIKLNDDLWIAVSKKHPNEILQTPKSIVIFKSKRSLLKELKSWGFTVVQNDIFDSPGTTHVATIQRAKIT